MEVSPQGKKQNLQTHARKSFSKGAHKDLWLVVREGSLADVDSALVLVKKSGGGFLQLVLTQMLGMGSQDGVAFTELLHFGHLAVASVLLQFGASITLEDSKYRTPVDLISGPVLQVLGSGRSSVTTEVFSWGSGANYQLGTGNAHIQKLPCKVDALHGSLIKFVSAAKFHSVAVTAKGEVYTWGFGRGGRLGHPDFDIHSGQAAVITPRQVTFDGGEVFSWGSNREGQLGYTSVDTQPTPRRVSSLRSKVVAVAAANKHTAVVSDTGEVFTWGGNREGQLGYGTSNSASNYTPRVVEYLKGKVFVGVAAAKYHTIVLGVMERYTHGVIDLLHQNVLWSLET
ncbi:hypothetical protein M0R45_000222 [Rubus argutus]|uniref:Uncharacterized protein n=1 Tax=Rubus argutus TaxID=59490 RepID=A0AAW1VNB7_RUBAR